MSPFQAALNPMSSCDYQPVRRCSQSRSAVAPCAGVDHDTAAPRPDSHTSSQRHALTSITRARDLLTFDEAAVLFAALADQIQ
jgi:hypothetical protein